MKDELLFKIGQNVRYIRLKNSLSQEELAFRAGLNMNSISTLERGVNNVKIKTLYSKRRFIIIKKRIHYKKFLYRIQFPKSGSI